MIQKNIYVIICLILLPIVCFGDDWDDRNYISLTDSMGSNVYEYLYNILPFETPRRGNGYVDDRNWSAYWFGDYSSHTPAYLATHYVRKSNGEIVRGVDLTPAKVTEYGSNARAVFLWMGDYQNPKESLGWGTGAEICYYKLTVWPLDTYRGGAWENYGWNGLDQKTDMEFILSKKDTNQIVSSCSKNIPSGQHRTWWLGAWCSPWGWITLNHQDLVLYFRVEKFWGNTWKKWESHKEIADVKPRKKSGYKSVLDMLLME